MPSVLSKNDKFGYYLYLPKELRMMIIDEMQPLDRCRFTECSMLSLKESKESDKYVYGLKLLTTRGRLTIRVVHGVTRREIGEIDEQGFEIRFENSGDRKQMICKRFDGRDVWRTEMHPSADVFHFGLEHFKEILEHYKNKIKSLHIDLRRATIDARTVDFGINRFNNLEKLEVQEFHLGQLVSKTRKTLKELRIIGNVTMDLKQVLQEIENGWEKVIETSEILVFPNNPFTFEEFSQLAALNVSTSIGDLTESDVCKIVRSWQNATIDKSYAWTLDDSNFDVDKLFSLIGGEVLETNGTKRIYVKHLTNNRRAKCLTFFPNIHFLDFTQL